MTNLTAITGKTEKEIKTLVNFGATESQAREIVQETFKDTLGLN
jgi:hypothetical protein